MIYVDDLQACRTSKRWPWPESCHLFCDVGALDSLHSFAARLGLKRRWFQPNPRLPHYDLTPNKRAQAVKQGAAEATREDMVKKSHEWRDHLATVQAPALHSIHAAIDNA